MQWYTGQFGAILPFPPFQLTRQAYQTSEPRTGGLAKPLQSPTLPRTHSTAKALSFLLLQRARSPSPNQAEMAKGKKKEEEASPRRPLPRVCAHLDPLMYSVPYDASDQISNLGGAGLIFPLLISSIHFSLFVAVGNHPQRHSLRRLPDHSGFFPPPSQR